MNEKKNETYCKSVFKTGDETTREAFTCAMARAIARIENDKPSESKDPEERHEEKADT